MSYDLLPEPLQWHTSRAGQGILIDGRSVLLSGNRWYTGKPLVWTLPGGRSEPGEGVADALIREFQEETGLDVEVGALAYVAEARSLVRKQLFINCAFVVTRLSGSLTCEADTTVEELRFVPISDLHIYMPSPSIGEPLCHYLQHPTGQPRYWFYPEYTAE